VKNFRGKIMNDHDRALIPAPQIESGRTVLTPSGRTAIVVSVDTQRGEATVEWPAERASFRLQRLRPVGTEVGQ
jgi:hypothetical protein